MSNPSHNDRMELEIFDSFSKTVMRNASRNFAAAAKTRKKNESVNTDIVQYILKTHGENAVYPSEHFIDAGNGVTANQTSGQKNKPRSTSAQILYLVHHNELL